MSDILVRTGNGKTDLKYVGSATKNLKVLQKTGNKSVRWITTAAGQSYNNILVKNGARNLAYQTISIPSDAPEWYGNPYSGKLVSWPYQNPPQWSSAYNYGLWITLDAFSDNVNLADNNWQYSNPKTNLFKRGVSSYSPFRIYFYRYESTSTWELPLTKKELGITKFFVVDVNNPSRKAVYLLSRTSSSVSASNYPARYHADYTIRNSYVTIDNFFDGGTYRIGVRASDS